MKTGFAVLDAMTRKPIVVTSSVMVRDCALLMEKKDVGSVLVVEDDHILGIVVEEDIVRRVVGAGKDPLKLTVADIMTRTVVSVEPRLDIYDALVLLRDKGIRTLPVVANGVLVGMLTLKDILRIEPDLFDIVADKWEIREASDKPLFGQGL